MASGDYVVDDKWKCFCYNSDSGRYRSDYRYHNSSTESIYYHHWLPVDEEDLLPQELPAVVEELPDFYEEFDTLIHTTTLENALEIFHNGFKPRPVVDSSVINNSYALLYSFGKRITPRPRHPISNASVLWYEPCTFKQLQDPTYIAKRYGNVVFSMKSLFGYEGIIGLRGGLNIYFIEVIQYMTSTACRILVTHKDYPTLRRYDPYTIGGPLYIKEGRFYSTNRLKRRDGRVVDNVLEIMQEEWTDDFICRLRRKNHSVSFFNCLEPRKSVKDLVVSLEEDDATEDDFKSCILQNILKLAMVLATLVPFKDVKLLTPFDSEQARDERLQRELRRVHEEAMKGYKGEHSDLLHLCVHGVVHEMMSKRSIIHTYRDMLHLAPQHSHAHLPYEIWERISKVFSEPIEL